MKLIQVATEAELEQALSVRRRVFVQEQACPPEEEFDQFDRLGACEHIVVLKDGSPVATARLVPHSTRKGVCRYQRIAVDKPCRKLGYGALLLAALDAIAKERGYRQVRIHAQVQAQGFYEKYGFAPAGPERFVEAGIPHLYMEKQL